MMNTALRQTLRSIPTLPFAVNKARSLRRAVPHLPHRMVLKIIEWYLRRATTSNLSGDVLKLEEALATEHDQSARLAHLLSEPLRYFDIGARYGPALHLMTYKQFFEFYLVEPEPSEAERLKAHGFNVVDKALSDQCGTVSLYVTRKPGSTSIIEPHGALLPYRVSDTSLHDVMRKIDIPATTIDQVAEEAGVHFDAIKLDTQGSETRILRGMTACRPQIIVSEVFLGELYRHRPTFYDVVPDLYDRGYIPFWLRLSNIPPPKPYRLTGRRGWVGLPLSGDVGFMPDWSRPEGQEIILQDDCKFAALMLVYGLEDVLRYVVEQLELPNGDRIREALAKPLSGARVTKGNMALKP